MRIHGQRTAASASRTVAAAAPAAQGRHAPPAAASHRLDRISLEIPSERGTSDDEHGVVQRVKAFLDDEDKRAEVMLPDGSSIHVEIDARETVADLKAYLAERYQWDRAALAMFEFVGVDDPVGDEDRLVPHLIYKAKLQAHPAHADAVAEQDHDDAEEADDAARVGDPSGKLTLASVVQAALGAIGFEVFLGGGAAVAALGSGRAIKDLDFKMGAGLKEAYRANHEAVADAVAEAMRGRGLTVTPSEINPYVMRFLVGDEHVEVSITTTGSYDAEQTETVQAGDDAAPVTMVGTLELLLDKLFAFSERSADAVDKLATDFIDIATLIQREPSLVDPGLLAERLTAYLKKWKRDSASAKQQAESKKKRGVDAEPNGYRLLAPDIGVQIAMRTSLVLHDSELRERYGLRQLRIWIGQIGATARIIQQLSRNAL